jgi:hypothetical protein
MGLEENYGQPQPRVRNLKEEKVWQGMAVERASLSEYGEPFNRVGNQVDDAGTDGEGAEPWSRPNYFFLLGLYAYLRLPSHTRIPHYKMKEDKRGNVYLKRVEGESMGLRVNPWKNSTLGKGSPKPLQR